MPCLLLVLLSTPLGWFVVLSGITAAGTPDPDYAAFWKPPSLLVTVAHRPWAVLECRRLVAGDTVTVWGCG